MNPISFEFPLISRSEILAHLSQKLSVSYSVNSVQNLSVRLSVYDLFHIFSEIFNFFERFIKKPLFVDLLVICLMNYCFIGIDLMV